MQWCEKILANDRSHMIVVGILLQFIGFPVGKSKTTEKYNLVYNKNTNHEAAETFDPLAATMIVFYVLGTFFTRYFRYSTN